MEKTKTITTIRVDNFSSLENGNHIVLRCDDKECIYKTLEIPKDHYITLYNNDYRNTWQRMKLKNPDPIRGSVQKVDEKTTGYSYLNNYTHVKLLARPGDISKCTTRKIVIGDLTINHDQYSSNFDIIEESNNLFLNVYSIKVPLHKLDYKNLSYYEDSEASRILNAINNLPINNSIDNIRKIIKHTDIDYKIVKPSGILKTFKTIEPFYEAESDKYSKLAFKAIVDSSKRTINGVTVSVLINRLFKNVDTQEKFSSLTKELSKYLVDPSKNYYSYDTSSYVNRVLDAIPDARNVKKTVLKRKSTGAVNKIIDDLDFIAIDEKKYPLSHAAVHGGEIPIGTFFRKSGDNYFIYNDNWELWEPMLANHKDIVIQIAKNCSGRSTYEKDIMSYFYFVLHKLPNYLNLYTGKTWKGIPKFVSSSNELDPPKEGATGTAKTRSALTPIVNNEDCTVEVPYVAMVVSGGYGSTYCYGLDYSLLDKGLSFKGNVVTENIERELNGRDNYGLMFYTLTGSSNGRGYPTFLIIFENLDHDIKVHFHRTHPMRSKGGDYNPIHKWTKGCYKWMIGNVNFERIKAQQGDLAFVKIDTFPENNVRKVNGYDGHMFDVQVDFSDYIKKDKQNILGYVKLENNTLLKHEEHMHRVIPKGIYEIRQCRSWEANPKGVWSLRID